MSNACPEPKLKRKYKCLNSAEWKALIDTYSTGAATLNELGHSYGVSVRAIQNHLKRAGIVKGVHSGPTAAGGGARIEHVPVLPSALSVTAKIRRAKDAALDDAECIQALLGTALADERLACGTLHPAALIRLAEQAAHTLDRVHRIQRSVLGMDRENANADVELPVLPIREMTAEEVAAMRAQQAAEDAETGYGQDELPSFENDEDHNPVIEQD